MRFNVVTVGAVLVATAALGACSSQTHNAQSTAAMSSSAAPTAMQATSTAMPAMSSAMPAMPAAARTGMFQGQGEKHVAGTVRVTGAQLELSNFSSDAGPDLHLYLANGTDESAVAAGKELGRVAFDQATQSFSLSGIDASQYHTVVINCDKAKSVFGSATLA